MTALDLDFQNPEAYTDIPDKNKFIEWVKISCSLDTLNTDDTEKNSYSVSVRIVSEQEAQSLNKQYREKDYATNVLSFPFDPPPIPMESVHLGDLVLCKPVVEKEAQEQHKHLNDHWAHLIIHGTLHLQGYDHISNEQADKMESLEILLLKNLGIDNPYITNAKKN